MKTRWTMAAILALSSFAAQAKSPQQPLEQWQTYANAPQVKASDLGDYQAMAVFYRLDNVSGAPVNVYVDGHYQASLLPQSYSMQAVCADKQLFSVGLSHSDGFEPVNHNVRETLPLREVAFFRVSLNEQGQPELQRVPAEVAQTELAGAKLVGQTLSRAPAAHQLNCQAPVLQSNHLSAQALFGFNQYAYEAILPAAQIQLNEIANQIKQLGESGVKKVVITGHSDPEGSDIYNHDLSQKRAQTIQAALQKNGGVSVPMEAVGLGASELKVADCANKYPHDKAARQMCNQPNRRVEIMVYGQSGR